MPTYMGVEKNEIVEKDLNLIAWKEEIHEAEKDRGITLAMSKGLSHNFKSVESLVAKFGGVKNRDWQDGENDSFAINFCDFSFPIKITGRDRSAYDIQKFLGKMTHGLIGLKPVGLPRSK